MNNCLSGTMSLGANLLSIFVPSYFLTVTKLPPSYKSHKLHGNLEGIWECHITPDWLMLWEQNDEKLTLLFLNNGTHSDLF
nr:type II toxin-antitoxin system YafQ family toxin [Prevotella sp.]